MIKAIVALREKDGGIGVANQLPWNIKPDLKHFKEKTSGCIVIMGYNTMLSLGRPLPNRTNLVIVRDMESPVIEGFTRMMDYDIESIRELGELEELWVIGGAKTYQMLEHLIEEWEITYVQADDVVCDAFYKPSLTQFNNVNGPFPPSTVYLNKDNELASHNVQSWHFERYIRRPSYTEINRMGGLIPDDVPEEIKAVLHRWKRQYIYLFGGLVDHVCFVNETSSKYHDSRHLVGCSFLMFSLYCEKYGFSQNAINLSTAMLFHDFNYKSSPVDIENIDNSILGLEKVFDNKELFSVIGIDITRLQRVKQLIYYTEYNFDYPFPTCPNNDDLNWSWMRDIDQLYASFYFDENIFNGLYQDIGVRFGISYTDFIERNKDYCKKVKFYTPHLVQVFDSVLPLVLAKHDNLPSFPS